MTDAAKKITGRIEELGGWRGDTLARVRQLIHDADPDVEKEWKWEKPSLFNSSLEGKTRRAIDIREGEKLNEAAFKALIKAAVAANAEAKKK